MHWALKSVCDQGGDASQLLGYNGGYFKTNPFKALTYVESPDTDNSPGQQIAFSKGLCYWFLLTSEGQPEIYYRDWSNDKNCYDLGPIINNPIWIHENLAFGTTTARYGDHSVACFERTGYPGLLTAGNWDTYNNRTITVQTNFGANVLLHDYTGHAPDVWTDYQGRVTITVPCNAYGNGKGFVAYSRPGYTQAFGLQKKTTTQEFFGADDLDIGAAIGGATVKAGRIWCDANTKIEFKPGPSFTGLTFGILNQDGLPVSLSAEYVAEATRRGFYTLAVLADATITRQPYDFAVTYTGTQDLHDSEV
jgi:alpha-amylase